MSSQWALEWQIPGIYIINRMGIHLIRKLATWESLRPTVPHDTSKSSGKVGPIFIYCHGCVIYLIHNRSQFLGRIDKWVTCEHSNIQSHRNVLYRNRYCYIQLWGFLLAWDECQLRGLLLQKMVRSIVLSKGISCLAWTIWHPDPLHGKNIQLWQYHIPPLASGKIYSCQLRAFKFCPGA